MTTSMSIESEKRLFTRLKDMPFHAIIPSPEPDACGP